MTNTNNSIPLVITTPLQNTSVNSNVISTTNSAAPVIPVANTPAVKPAPVTNVATPTTSVSVATPKVDESKPVGTGDIVVPMPSTTQTTNQVVTPVTQNEVKTQTNLVTQPTTVNESKPIGNETPNLPEVKNNLYDLNKETANTVMFNAKKAINDTKTNLSGIKAGDFSENIRVLQSIDKNDRDSEGNLIYDEAQKAIKKLRAEQIKRGEEKRKSKK